MPSKTDLYPTDAAYIAGLVDGEGSIGWYGHHHTLRVNMSNIDAIAYLHRTAGGTVTYRHGGTAMAAWCVKATGDLLWLLPQIIPHLTTKRREAVLMLRALELFTDGRNPVDKTGRELVSHCLKDLKAESRNVTREAVGAMR